MHTLNCNIAQPMPCLQYYKGWHYTAPPFSLLLSLLYSSWPFTQPAAFCVPVQPKPSLAQLSHTLPYPSLPYTIPTPPNPLVAHSTLPQIN